MACGRRVGDRMDMHDGLPRYPTLAMRLQLYRANRNRTEGRNS